MMRSDRDSNECKRCASVCGCGRKKDFRAVLCRWCRSKIQATEQWANPDSRARIAKGVRDAGVRRRRRYADLGFESFNMKKADGRSFGFYWDGDRRRYEYRYQWVWKQANGPIPEGMHIHHINGDSSDDRIENLAMMSRENHLRIHTGDPVHQAKMLAARGLKPTDKTLYKCERCGVMFKSYPRYKDGIPEPRRFCSMRCRR